MAAQWHTIITLDALEVNDVTQVRFNTITLAVYDTDDGIYVSNARCSHAGANLCDGYFDGKSIECPLHQGLFDARTGVAKAAPALRPLKMYESRVKKGAVQIKIAVPEVN